MRSWKLGTAFGIGIYIHWTFLLLPLFILFNTWGTSGLRMAAYSVALVLTIFGCVVLHELGHALMARYFGIGTRDITLYPIGGVARLERMSERPLEEFFIALAGPAVNVVIAALLAVLVAFLGMAPQFHQDGTPSYAMGDNPLIDLFLANTVLVLLNMLPAFPMDGGRVLRALLATGFGYLRATEIAVYVGMVMIGLIALAAILSANLSLLLLAGFVFLAGQAELAAVRRREANRWADVLDVLPADDDSHEPMVHGDRPLFQRLHLGQPLSRLGPLAERPARQLLSIQT